MLAMQITVRDLSVSPALESTIRKKAQRLTRFYKRINSCRVVLEKQQNHKHQGKLYNVRVDVKVPGKEIVTTHKCDEDIYIAIRDAFAAISRQLEEHGRKRHGRVKTHNHVMHGHVIRLIPSEGYGFIEGIDGNEYYFSVTNMSHPHFEQMAVGDSVEYRPETFSDGMQAHHVIKERHRSTAT